MERLICLLLLFSSSLLSGSQSHASDSKITKALKKDGSALVGESFLKVFGIAPELVSTQEESQTIFESSGVSLELKNSPASGKSAHLRMEGEQYNLFYFELDSDYIIKKARRIEITGAAPEVALSLVSAQQGMEKLKEAFGISPYCSPEEQERSLARKKAWEEKRKREAAVVPTNDFPAPVRPDSDEGLLVLQHESGVARYVPGRTVNALKTYGAGPCVILTLYDRKSKTGLLAHVDGLTDLKASLEDARKKFKELGGELCRKGEPGCQSAEIEIKLVGGDSSSRLQIASMRETLRELQHVSFQENILTGDIESAWLDLRTGSVSRFELKPLLKSSRLPNDYFSQMKAQISQGTSPLRMKGIGEN